MESSTQGNVYTIKGIKVNFPFTPYPSQMAMMTKIISALENKENALLESPTGSGKSLALLCATLAWNKAQKQKALLWTKQMQQQRIKNKKTSSISNITKGSLLQDLNDMSDESDSDFQPSSKQAITSPFFDENKKSPRKSNEKVEESQENAHVIGVKPKVSVIYFGSRTHKQISQLIKELRTNTVYRPKMSILDHTCIHPKVSKLSSKQEACMDLVNNDGCHYFQRVRNFLHNFSSAQGSNEIWDIEDLITNGKKKSACPYYSARALCENAEIIFCPYNYLVDPMIRKALDIKLKDNIVILDEAHNIEDACREGGSFETNEDIIREIKHQCEGILSFVEKNEDGFAYNIETRRLLNFLDRLLTWMTNHEMYKINEYEKQMNIWCGFEIVAKFKELNYDKFSFSGLKNDFMRISDAISSKTEERNEIYDWRDKITSLFSMFFEGLFQILDVLFNSELQYTDDFRMVLSKKVVRASASFKRGGDKGPRTLHSLHFWCMNPGVAFSSISKEARAVILTSGTLSPLDSFASELQTSFIHRLEAAHVINKEQLWAGVISKGTDNQPLQGTYQHVQTFSYQDQVGNVLEKICTLVPHGVLAFFPSYSVIDTMQSRWQATGMLKRIQKLKHIFQEPKGSDKNEFVEVMTRYGKVIEAGRLDTSRPSGLFLAVYRGKISEGIDFSDESCRAVVAIGIPFPNIKDMQVGQKKKYNDKYSKSRNLLNGNRWYEIQAYRALNQAIGRCIRHRKDWGSVFLVDSRYSDQRHLANVSRWLRGSLMMFQSIEHAESSLKEFISSLYRDVVPTAEIQEELEMFVPEKHSIQEQSSLLNWLHSPEKSKNSIINPDISNGEVTALISPSLSSLPFSPKKLHSSICEDPSSPIRSMDKCSTTLLHHENGEDVGRRCSVDIEQLPIPATLPFKGVSPEKFDICCQECRFPLICDVPSVELTTHDFSSLVSGFLKTSMNTHSCTDNLVAVNFQDKPLPNSLEVIESKVSMGTFNAVWVDGDQAIYRKFCCKNCNGEHRQELAYQVQTTNTSSPICELDGKLLFLSSRIIKETTVKDKVPGRRPASNSACQEIRNQVWPPARKKKKFLT